MASWGNAENAQNAQNMESPGNQTLKVGGVITAESSVEGDNADLNLGTTAATDDVNLSRNGQDVNVADDLNVGGDAGVTGALTIDGGVTANGIMAVD